MTPVTNYFLDRLDQTGNVSIQVLDVTSYASYQVYVDNALLVETTSRTIAAVILPNKKIDVLGLSSGEAGTDFSGSLSDDYGDKVEFDLPYSYLGKAVKVYSDNQTGVIDYGRPLAVGVANGIVSGLGWATFLARQWGEFTAAEWNSFTADAPMMAKLTITKRLKTGPYKFALASFISSDISHSPYVLTKTISTTAEEITPYIHNYDSTLDELTIATNDDGIGTYKLYAAPWGAAKTAINFAVPIGSATDSPMVFSALRGSQTDNTRYFAVRKTSSNGVEEKNWNVIAFQLVGSEWVGNLASSSSSSSFVEPSRDWSLAPPQYLTGRNIDSGVQLQWTYQVNTAVPEGFRVYRATSLVATIPYTGQGVSVVNLDPIGGSTHFTVAAYIGNTESSISLVMEAPDELVDVTGQGATTWRDE